METKENLTRHQKKTEKYYLKRIKKRERKDQIPIIIIAIVLFIIAAYFLGR